MIFALNSMDQQDFFVWRMKPFNPPAAHNVITFYVNGKRSASTSPPASRSSSKTLRDRPRHSEHLRAHVTENKTETFGPEPLHCSEVSTMAVMLSKTYAAFKAAGAPDGIAREASEEIAGFENRLSGIESDVKLLKWMVGTNIVLMFGILIRLFTA